MEQRYVFVVGYPKSGCVWLTRLVAELMECPASGFLEESGDDMAAEGHTRISQFCVVRAHQQWHELAPHLHDSSKVIYIVRDPRDVAISGAHYFRVERRPLLGRILSHLLLSRKRYHRTLYFSLSPEDYRIERMVQAVLFGDETVSSWCRISWKEHFMEFRRPEVLLVRYEDLLKKPQQECNRILKFVGYPRDVASIARAIEKQSFQQRKREFRAQGDVRREQFLRVGKSGQWATSLTDKQRAAFEENVGDLLALLGYENNAGNAGSRESPVRFREGGLVPPFADSQNRRPIQTPNESVVAPGERFRPRLDALSRALRIWARSSLPGKNSAFRKFRRRNLGRHFHITTKQGFSLEGTVGDSVENAIAIRGEHEPALTKFFTVQFQNTASFVDIGCNIGYFSCLFRHLRPRGRLLAIDANPQMAEACRQNLVRNNAGIARFQGDTSVLALALGAEAGSAQFRIPKDRLSRATLGELQLPLASIDVITVPVDTLASVLATNGFSEVDSVKLDIEGSEIAVLGTLPSSVAERINCIVFEFSDTNFHQCGAAREDLMRIEWLRLFTVASLDERSGTLHLLSSILDFAGSNGTIVLSRR